MKSSASELDGLDLIKKEEIEFFGIQELSVLACILYLVVRISRSQIIYIRFQCVKVNLNLQLSEESMHG